MAKTPATDTPAKLGLLKQAVDEMADCMLGLDTGGVFNRMTCTEAESIAFVLGLADRKDAAAFVLTEHSEGDTDPEDMHHNGAECEG